MGLAGIATATPVKKTAPAASRTPRRLAMGDLLHPGEDR
jgi:hypothetical protein